MARRTVNDESLDPYVRVSAALHIRRVLGGVYKPPAGLHPSIESNEPLIIQHFAKWFAKNEASIAAEAAKETEALAKARAELAAIRQCAD